MPNYSRVTSRNIVKVIFVLSSFYFELFLAPTVFTCPSSRCHKKIVVGDLYVCVLCKEKMSWNQKEWKKNKCQNGKRHSVFIQQPETRLPLVNAQYVSLFSFFMFTLLLRKRKMNKEKCVVKRSKST
jgi:hypothetical protein